VFGNKLTGFICNLTLGISWWAEQLLAFLRDSAMSI